MTTAKKKKQQKVVRLIRKSNELVEGRYKFDIWETRVFTSMISMIKRSDDDFKPYRIYINDLVKEYGLDNAKSPYQRVKIASQKLMSKIVRTVREEEGELMEFMTPIVAGIKNPQNAKKGKGFVELSFHPDMKPLLLQLKEEFTTYDVRNVLRLPSTYSTRIYELLKQYEKIGKRRISFYDIKLMVGASELVSYEGGKDELVDSYPKYGNFRQKVLLQAQKDLINHTDISFTFETVKKGRRVEEIIFYISKNTPRRDRGIRQATKEKESHIYDILSPKFANWPEQPKQELIIKLLNNGHTEEQIKEATDYIENRRKKGDKIGNYIAYFRTIVKEVSKQGDLFNNPIKKQKEKEVKRRESQKQRQELKAQYEERIKKLSVEISEERADIIKKVEKENPEIYQKVIEQVKAHNLYDRTKTYKQNIERKSFGYMPSYVLKKIAPNLFIEVVKLEAEVDQLRKEEIRI